MASTYSLAAELEPGDRFEVVATDGCISLPEFLQANPSALVTLEDPAGQPLVFERDTASVSVQTPGFRQLDFVPSDVCWLEYQGDSRFRLVIEKLPTPTFSGEVRTPQGVRISFDPSDWLASRGTAHRASRAEFDLALQAARLSNHAGFDRLICLPLVRDMEVLDHQVRTAKTVLQRFRGHALLCDEVGLGKTIEAGLIFAELHTRGLVRSALVLVPPSLIEQWQGEMRRKFSLELIGHDDPLFRAQGAAAWKEFDLVIASMHTAKREPHRSAIIARHWDLVIVDEAHHLRNRQTQLWRFASALQTQFTLLLTATPVQNNLEELFNLVTLLEPGLLRTARQFQKEFVDRRDKLMPRNLDELHRLLAEVMVRNRRSTVGLQFTRRWAHTEQLSPSPGEQELYAGIAEFVRQHLPVAGGKGKLSRMALMALQTALGSSSQAAAGTLERLAETPSLPAGERATLLRLAEQARGLTDSAKADRLLRLLEEYPDKIVVFTQFRATQDMLAACLQDAGHDVALFHGSLTRLAKEAAVVRFRGPARILLATDAGSEGRNLQFAHAICNYDLPWNPMRIEQRIGRLSRIGQTKDVQVYNLVAAGTIEAAVLHLLEAKLNLFELVIGEIDMILGNLEEEREFEDLIADLWGASADLEDFRRRMEELGERLLTAKESYLRQRSHDERLFGDRFAPGSLTDGIRMTIDTTASEIVLSPLERFVRAYLEATGGVWDEIEPQVYDVLLPPDVEGAGPAPPAGGVLRISFDPEALPDHPGTQLASFGTPFIDRLLGDALQRGRSARFWLVGLNLTRHDLTTRLRRALPVAVPGEVRIERVRALEFPQAVFWFRVEFVSDQKEQVVVPVTIDLHYGREARHLEQLLDPARLAEQPAQPLPEVRRASVAAAYSTAWAEAQRTIAALANIRGRELEERCQQQLARLRHYYADLRSELEDQSRRGRPAADAEDRLAQRRAALDREEQQRIAELRQKSTLHVSVALLQLLQIQQPKLLAHVTLIVPKRPPGQLEVVWDPLSETVEAPPCPSCGRPGYAFDVDRQGHVVCPACATGDVGTRR